MKTKEERGSNRNNSKTKKKEIICRLMSTAVCIRANITQQPRSRKKPYYVHHGDTCESVNTSHNKPAVHYCDVMERSTRKLTPVRTVPV